MTQEAKYAEDLRYVMGSGHGGGEEAEGEENDDFGEHCKECRSAE